MLRLSKITKDYKVADTTVKALKGINLSFRKNEFVSVLGPSGCGKTTLLNIIGGLDKYTSGDLFINGRSTKEFKDRDWDVYRNHRVGFIFQSYNLIPHQTILANVELALTIAGIGKNERTKRAKLALDKVGLKGQYGKKPNQLSGGQCQRVAIARALVNDPEILLADEPTGALDTTTSVQIMELIKEIANDRLVIMVTHNPDLATQYSTRIIKLLDGEVVDDNNPFSEEEEKEEIKRLNLEAVEYFKKKESELLEENKKLQNNLENMQKNDKKRVKELKKQLKANKINLKRLRQNNENYVISSKTKKGNKSEKAKMSFFTAFKLSAQNLFTKKGRTILTSIAGAIGIIGVSLVLSISCGVRTYISDMQDDMLSGNPIAISQTAMDLGAIMDSSTFGQRAKAIKKAGLVNVDSMIEYLVTRSEQASKFRIKNEITEEYVDFVKAVPREHVASLFLDYGLDVTNNIYTDFKESEQGPVQNLSLSVIKNIYTSVLKKTDYAEYASLIAGLGDTFMQAPSDSDYILSQYNLLSGNLATKENEVMIVVSRDRELTDLLLTQLGYLSQDQFLNIIYKSTDDDRYLSTLDKDEFEYSELLGKKFTYFENDKVFNKQSIETNPFTYNPSSEGLEGGLELKVVGILEPKEDISYGCLEAGFFYTEALANHIITTNADSQIVQYLNDPSNENQSISSVNYGNGVAQGITYKYSYSFDGVKYDDVVGCVGTANAMLSVFGGMMGQKQDIETFTLKSYEIGGSKIPYQIKVYPVDFNHKDAVREYLDKWNGNEDLILTNADGESYTLKASDRVDITYTDNISVIISMVNSMIDIVTYALVGFTGLSLVVSCVMIAIITYVSVVERTKEIGVIRSLGGRKKDVSYLFNAETFIIGFSSGLIGIGVTYLLSALANLIIRTFTELTRIAIFPWHYALIMVAVSVFLTVISGLIPASSAARRDPVNALRSE